MKQYQFTQEELSAELFFAMTAADLYRSLHNEQGRPAEPVCFMLALPDARWHPNCSVFDFRNGVEWYVYSTHRGLVQHKVAQFAHPEANWRDVGDVVITDMPLDAVSCRTRVHLTNDNLQNLSEY